MERKKLEALVWKHKHKDFRGKLEDGTKCVLHYVAGTGTCSAPLASLTEAELVAMLPKTLKEMK
jgi:hypothetical protein